MLHIITREFKAECTDPTPKFSEFQISAGILPLHYYDYDEDYLLCNTMLLFFFSELLDRKSRNFTSETKKYLTY